MSNMDVGTHDVYAFLTTEANALLIKSRVLNSKYPKHYAK
jgi:hypothetical protein